MARHGLLLGWVAALLVVSALAELAPLDLNAPALDARAMAAQANEYAAGRSSWLPGVSDFWANRTLADAVRMFSGVRLTKASLVRARRRTGAGTHVALPDSFDSAVQWPACKIISQIYDQGGCGSCYAFGAIEALQDRFCIATHGSNQTPLSVQDVVSCASEGSHYMDGCKGGDPNAAWSYAWWTGVVSAQCMPYSIPGCTHPNCPAYPTPPCNPYCSDMEDYKKAKHWAKQPYGVDSDPEEIMEEIMELGPVEACFIVYRDFLSYKSGVYTNSGSKERLGGHCVKMTGWGVEAATKTPYWILSNSWNKGWGMSGRFFVLRGQDTAQIEDFVYAAEAKTA